LERHFVSETQENEMDDQGTKFKRLSYRLNEAVTATGMSKTRLYAAIRSRKLRVRKDGKATILLADELEDWLHSLKVIGKPLSAPVIPEPRTAA
jgi:hypothetical protein